MWVRRLFAGLAGLTALAGCDDGWRIDRQDRFRQDVRAYVVPLAAGGLPTEVRGAPFPGIDAGQVIERLRPPNGFPADIRFRQARPEDGGRLILLFNPAGAPDGYALCRGGGPAPGAARQEGFVTLASLCDGDRMVSTARLVVERIDRGDPDAFQRVMRNLLRVMFDDDPV
jgi:hypothetical protein